VLNPARERTSINRRIGGDLFKANVNGIEMAYERRGGGFPLVLVHGYPLDHSIWNQVIALLEAEFDVIAPDLRGFGQSGTVKGRYLLTDMAADIAGLLDVLQIEQAAIAGHSMGGYIVMAFARLYGMRVQAMGLVATQALADSPEKRIARNREAEHVLAHGVWEVAEGMSGGLTAEPALQMKLKDLILKQRPEVVAGALRAMADRPDSTDILPTFDFPTVIVHGLADSILPVERAREMKRIIKNCWLVEIEGAGHMPMMETPQETAGALRDLH
jgi:3-oxoadipate enol-lactonase